VFSAVHFDYYAEKYFGHLDKLPGGLGKDFMRIFYSLHDIGDSLGKTTQEKLFYNRSICTEFMIKMGFDKKKINTAEALLMGDPLGSYLKKSGGLAQATSLLPKGVQLLLKNSTPIQKILDKEQNNLANQYVPEIRAMANKAGMSYTDYFELLTIFHTIDAGTYTTEGGSVGSLNYIFTFDKEGKKMNYSKLILPLIDKLKVAVNMAE